MIIGQIHTVGDLRAALEEFDDDQPIALATQPNYPFEYTIAKVVAVDEGGEDGLEKVYLAEGTQVGYLSGAASEELDWR